MDRHSNQTPTRPAAAPAANMERQRSPEQSVGVLTSERRLVSPDRRRMKGGRRRDDNVEDAPSEHPGLPLPDERGAAFQDQVAVRVAEAVRQRPEAAASVAMNLKHGTSTGRGATASSVTARGERRAARWLTRADLCRRLRISRATSYRLESEGYLPKPVRIGPGTIRWSVTELETFERRILDDRGAVSIAGGAALGHASR